jgi:2-polyprenyl-6-methoxyphenol hydroxylase-like FAD-dependent oxidoreductase
MNREKWRIDENSIPIVESSSPIATGLLELIDSSPSVAGNSNKGAPFANYRENNDLLWQNVSDKEVISYLKNRVFVQINRERPEPDLVIDTNEDDEGIMIPLDNVVGAQGFNSWTGWSVEGAGLKDLEGQPFGIGALSSLNAMKMYAGMPSELPPVSEMEMYIQPDGMVLFYAGDAHRTGAAILRGYEHVRAEKLKVYYLDYHLVAGQ